MLCLLLAACTTLQIPPQDSAEASSLCRRTIAPECGKVHDVDVSPDGELVLVGCENGHTLLYEIATGALRKDLDDRRGPVVDVEFDASGTRILVVSYRAARVWNAQTYELGRTIDAWGSGLLRGCFSPDGRFFAVGEAGTSKDEDATQARVFDVTSGTQVAAVAGLSQRVMAKFSPDGTTLLATCGGQPGARTLELDGRHTPRVSKGHELGIAESCWSPDGKTFLTVSADRTARIWNAATGRELQTLSGHTGYVTYCSYSPDGKEVATTSWVDRTTRVYGTKSGKERLKLEGHTDRPVSVRFAPDGRSIASFDASGYGKLFELERGERALSYGGHTDIVAGLDFTPDSKLVVTGAFDGSVRVWANPRATR